MKKISKIIIILILVLGIFFIFNDKLFIKNNPFKELTNILVIPIEKITTEIKSIKNYKTVIKENNQLQKDLLLLETTKEKNKELEKEITELKNLTKLQKAYTDYKYNYAKVISRNNLYWFDTFIIDKGSKDNIKIDNAVLTKDGLIGKVISTSKNISTVRMITSNYEDNKLSVSFKNNNKTTTGVIKEFVDNFIVVESTIKYDKISQDTKVYTSGFGNLPKGLLIGKIKKVEEDRFGISNILYVEISSNIDDINYVMVLSK